jgi:hypothetical protein
MHLCVLQRGLYVTHLEQAIHTPHVGQHCCCTGDLVLCGIKAAWQSRHG